jgi:hypothetical protein
MISFRFLDSVFKTDPQCINNYPGHSSKVKKIIRENRNNQLKTYNMNASLDLISLAVVNHIENVTPGITISLCVIIKELKCYKYV